MLLPVKSIMKNIKNPYRTGNTNNICFYKKRMVFEINNKNTQLKIRIKINRQCQNTAIKINMHYVDHGSCNQSSLYQKHLEGSLV